MAATRWLTFDCYGTIADWGTCMQNALAAHVGATTAGALLAAYQQAELILEAGPSWRPYSEIVAAGLGTATRRLETSFEADPAEVMLAAWEHIPVFDDVPEALAELKSEGWRLAILANCDQEQFALTEPQLSVPFDLVVTAEQVRSYKPDLAHFRKFAEITQATPSNWIHVANSWVRDILPAARTGLRAVWVDRERTGHPAKFAERRITAMRRLPETVRDVNALRPWQLSLRDQ